MTYAYARVSAKDQNLQRQIAAFREFGIEKSRIFSEKKSGKNFERREYKRLLKKLTYGDLLVIKSIDRLGRNYSQIIEEWNRITNIIGADILVLDIAAFRHPHKGGYFGRQVHFGYSFAGVVVRGGKRTGKHKGAAGRGNKDSKGKGRPFRPPFVCLFKRIFIRCRRLLLQARRPYRRFAAAEYKAR